MDMDLVKKIEELRRLSVAESKEIHREVFGNETRCFNKQYLFRRSAWRLQAQSEGGVSEKALRRAWQIADNADLRLGGAKGFWTWPGQERVSQPQPSTGTPRDGRLPEPGTLLKRRYEGRQIVVKVLDLGFEYQSRHDRSLSAIAREVTGARWNGLLFFGLTGRRHG